MLLFWTCIQRAIWKIWDVKDVHYPVGEVDLKIHIKSNKQYLVLSLSSLFLSLAVTMAICFAGSEYEFVLLERTHTRSIFAWQNARSRLNCTAGYRQYEAFPKLLRNVDCHSVTVQSTTAQTLPPSWHTCDWNVRMNCWVRALGHSAVVLST